MSPLIIKSFVLFVQNIIIKCISVKILWETFGVDSSSVGSPLMFLFLNFSTIGSQKLVIAFNWCVKAQGGQEEQLFKLVHSTKSASNK